MNLTVRFCDHLKQIQTEDKVHSLIIMLLNQMIHQQILTKNFEINTVNFMHRNRQQMKKFLSTAHNLCQIIPQHLQECERHEI